jgi:hypothetical protein
VRYIPDLIPWLTLSRAICLAEVVVTLVCLVVVMMVRFVMMVVICFVVMVMFSKAFRIETRRGHCAGRK